MIAHFGTGLMGAGFVRAALARGETVSVWNRSPDKAKALERDGAKAFAHAADAARGATQIHVTLADDAAVDSVLEPLADVLEPATRIIDHTTTAPTPTAARYARWKQRGIFFAHVPMFMGPKNALEHTGLMLVSGSAERHAIVRPLVEPMTGRLIHVGDGDERAAAFKLFGNMMLFFITAGLADVFTLAESMGISAVDAVGLFAEFKVAGAIDGRGNNMARGDFTPAFELTMARKDVRLMLEEGARGNANFHVLPQIAAVMDRAIAAGRGGDDVGAIAAS